MEDDHTFCRLFLKESFKDISNYLSKDYLRSVWVHKTNNRFEVHFPKCELLPDGFYWYGRAHCAYGAKGKAYCEIIEKLGKNCEH